MKQIVIARENGAGRGSEILAKFRCLGCSLLPANGVGIMSCGAGDRHQIGWNVMLHRGHYWRAICIVLVTLYFLYHSEDLPTHVLWRLFSSESRPRVIQVASNRSLRTQDLVTRSGPPSNSQKDFGLQAVMPVTTASISVSSFECGIKAGLWIMQFSSTRRIFVTTPIRSACWGELLRSCCLNYLAKFRGNIAKSLTKKKKKELQ